MCDAAWRGTFDGCRSVGSHRPKEAANEHSATAQAPIRTTVPARLDRLNWSPFHTRMVAGLGAAWILDGLQITIASSVTGVLTQPDTLGMTSTEVGLIASVYLIGQLIGALVFGRMSDQLGRKRLLITTLLLYLLGTGLAAFVTGHHTGWLVFFYATRLIAGMGIGGQYAAINSAIDEMMPSKYRGRVDIWINGSYWAGAILGSFASLIFLNAFAVNVGWRLAFLMGPVLALVVIVVARTLPESPRWLMTHGRVKEAEAELAKIEAVQGTPVTPVSDDLAIELVPETQYGYLRFLRLVFKTYPKRAILGARMTPTAPRSIGATDRGGTVSDHYDVIIIGSGAGGGTLAHTLAGSGKQILLLERGNYLPREMDNWRPEPVFIDGKYISKDTWYDADGKPFQPQVHYNVGGRHQAVRRRPVPAAPPGLRRDPATSTVSPRRGRSPMTTSSRGTRRPSSCTRSTATPARTPPRVPAPSRTRGRPCPTSRASSNSPMRWPPAATTRSTPRAASCSTRPTGPRARASAARGATATRAWSTPRPTPRSSPYGRSSTGPTSPCSSTPR